MPRRLIALLVTLVLTTLFVSPVSPAQWPAKNVPTIGVLSLGSPPSLPDWKQRSVLLQELSTLGWMEGQNVTVEYRWASGRSHRLTDLAAELVHRHVDVIVVDDTPAIQAVQHVTTTIPTVAFFAIDPVAEGYVASLARPGGNITGVGGVAPELSSKLLELLKEAVPGARRIAVFVSPYHPVLGQMVEETKRAAQAVGIQPQVLEVGNLAGLTGAFDAAMTERAGALLVLPGLLFSYNRQRMAELAVKNQLPAIYWQRQFAEVGGLMAYGPKLSDLYRRIAAYVDKILKGAKPADLPVEQPATFELVINLKNAQALGLTMPPTLLFQADEVIR
jgi:putative tryptophan/tyrosine transport system substrate-binding protein